MGSLATWRDIALIVLVLEGIVAATLLLVVTVGGLWLIRRSRQYLREYIAQAIGVTHMAREMASDLSGEAAEPIIAASSTKAAVEATIRAIFRKVRKQGGTHA